MMVASCDDDVITVTGEEALPVGPLGPCAGRHKRRSGRPLFACECFFAFPCCLSWL